MTISPRPNMRSARSMRASERRWRRGGCASPTRRGDPSLGGAAGAARRAAAPEIEPPRDLLPAIEARIRGAPPEAPRSATIVTLERRVTRWRTVAIAASLLAGILAIGFVAREATRQSAPREYVAILQKDAASPAIEVTVNLDRQEFTVRPVAAQAPPGKAYELWIIDAKIGAPRSLGVIGDTPRGASLSAYDPAIVAGATYAVTVEPPGGSPTGLPSGTPVFVGKLIPVGP